MILAILCLNLLLFVLLGVLSVLVYGLARRGFFARYIVEAMIEALEHTQESIEASVRGQNGVVRKAEKELMRLAAGEQITGDNPVLGAIWENLPKSWKDKIVAKPSYAIAAYQLLQNSGALKSMAGSNHEPSKVDWGNHAF